jgi:hypothetical protein
MVNLRMRVTYLRVLIVLQIFVVLLLFPKVVYQLRKTGTMST